MSMASTQSRRTEPFLADFLERRTSFYRMKADANGNYARGAADAPDWLREAHHAASRRARAFMNSKVSLPRQRYAWTALLLGSPGYDAGYGFAAFAGRIPRHS